MALFKISKGLKNNLDKQAMIEGYCWYTTDDSLFYIDFTDNEGNLQRKALNAAQLNPSINAGSENKPIYIKEGVPTKCGSSLNVDILGNATSATNANTLGGYSFEDINNLKMNKTNPRGSGSFAMNENTSVAIGDYAFIEGKDNSAEGKCAHAEGWGSDAHGEASHAEGDSYAEGPYSHAEGYGMTVGEESEYSHAEGYGTATYAKAAHAGGIYTWATAEAQMAIGKYNAQDDTKAFIIGNGTGQNYNQRSNAFSIDWNGNVYGATFSGNAATATLASTATLAEQSKKDANGNTIDTTYETKVDATTKFNTLKKYTDDEIAALVGAAPDALDTLEELANALKNNPDIVELLEESIATKADKIITLTAGKGLTGGGNLGENRTFDIGQGAGIVVAEDKVSAALQSETKSALTAATKASTSGKEYAVGLDSNGNLSVNIPWTDTTVVQHEKADNINYPILGAYSATPTTGTASTVIYDTGIHMNPSTNTITADIFKATKFIGHLEGNADTATLAATATVATNAQALSNAKLSNALNVSSSEVPTSAAVRAYIDNLTQNTIFQDSRIIDQDGLSSFTFSSVDDLSNYLVYYNGLLLTQNEHYIVESSNKNTVKLNGWSSEKGDIIAVLGKHVPDQIGAAITTANIGQYAPALDGTGANGTWNIDISGNAETATLAASATTATSAGAFTSAKSVTLTGDVSGSASSTGGWNITTTLANSGVTAGEYGPTANASPAHSGTFTVPQITVDAKGRVTSAASRTITLPAGTVTDEKVKTAANTSSTKSYVTTCTGATTGTLTYHTSVYVNHSTGVLMGAAWNDYAEYRISDCREPGRVICENGDDTLSLATERLQPAGNIISDTFGFAIGETETAKTPIAVSGRVLVYPYEDRYSYNPGDAVCAAPDGTVSKMTREEIITYPERIIGTVSAIPEYETWGEGNVPVDGRIWIKIK